jgi:hypothetical protein
VILAVADGDDTVDIINTFVYTNGIEPNDLEDIPTCPITQATTTLAFNIFRDITDF